MRIRSITYFCNPRRHLEEQVLKAGGAFLKRAKARYEAAGFEVQTTRLATVAFPRLLGQKHIDELPGFAARLEKLLQQEGIGLASLGPALPGMPRSYEVIPEAIAATQNIFFGGVMANRAKGIDLAAVRACAQVIVAAARLEPNGFANLRFAALANVRAGAPFFPAAYWDQDEPAFAIATEAADLAIQAFDGVQSLAEGRSALIAEIEKEGKRLAKVARSLNCKFGGLDFSVAPFPDEAHSLGHAVEKMGVPKIGLHGSLAAAAILTEAIERADFPRTGFSGFMQPVLEDSVLAQRAAEGTLTIKDTLLYCAVCGIGLDTLPLPGNTSAEQLVPLLLDLCALAMRLDKPLTARLMPIPGRKAGEPTRFNFGFFANSKVMRLDADPLKDALAGSEAFHLRRR